MELKDRIKHLRDDCDLTQNDLAQALNVARATISGYETKGKEPDVDKLVKLAALFNVSIDYLLTGNHCKPNISFDNLDAESELDKNILNMYSDLTYTDKVNLHHYLCYIYSKSIRSN